MAETTEKLKPTKVKYKFGADELDLLDYLNNLEHNVQSYLNSLKWNDGLKLEFSQAYRKILSAYQDLLKNNSGRFSTDSLGWITDTQGEFSNKDTDDESGSDFYYDDKGNRITTGDYNNLKKRKQKNYNTFSANREVANFFNTIGNALAKARRTTTTDDNSLKSFELAKNGFERWWYDRENPAGGKFDFAPYIEKDNPDETTGVRGTTARAEYLRDQLNNYLTNGIKDLDYSKSTFETKDAYSQKIRDAINGLANGYDPNDTIALRQAGLSNEFLNNFFSTGDKPKTEAELAAADIKRMQEELQELLIIALRDLMQYEKERDEYFNNLKPFESSVDKIATTSPYVGKAVFDYVSSKYKVDRANPQAMASAMKEYLNLPLFSDILRGKQKIKLGDGLIDITPQYIGNNLDLMYKNGLMTEKVGNTGYYVVPGSENYDNWSYIAYDPDTRRYLELSMLLNEELKKKMAYAEYDRRNKVPKLENGGVIQYLVGGELAKYVEAHRQKQQEAEQKQAEIKLRAEYESKHTSGRIGDLIAERSEREQKEGSRKLSEGLELDDYLRLGSAALDIASALSAFGIGGGTVASAVTGVGSTLATLGADLKDGFQWSDLGTAGYGLGMDLIGLIPGLGTAGKAAKIGKNLAKVAPYVFGALQALDALSEPSRRSWGKIMSGKFKDLTVDDLRNISSGITFVMSGSLHAGIRMKNAAMKSAAKTGDKQIESKTGEMLRISPEKLEAILKAKSLKDANKILKSIPGYEDKELASTFRSAWNPKRWWNWNPKVSDYYDFDKLKGTKFDNTGIFGVSDAKLFKAARTSNFAGFGLHMNIKNPYSKYLQTSKPDKPNTSKPDTSKPNDTPHLSSNTIDRLRELSYGTNNLTSKEISIINRLRKSQGKSALTKQEIEMLNKRRLRREENLELRSKKSEYGFIASPRDLWKIDKLVALDALKERLKTFKEDKRSGKFRTVEDDIKRARKELAEASIPKAARLLLANDIENTKIQRKVKANAGNVRILQLREMASRELSKAIPKISEPLTKSEHDARLADLDYAFLLLANDIANTRVERAVATNAGNVRTLLLREMANRVKSQQVPELPKAPLTGAAHTARENMYSRLFDLSRFYPPTLVTEPVGMSLTPKIPRKPTLKLHDANLRKYETLFPPREESKPVIEKSEKSEKGKRRAEYKKARELANEKKRLINELPYLSESKKREMTNQKKNTKSKKTSRDDKRTVKRQEGGTLNLNRVKKFLPGGLMDIANLATLLALNNGFFSTLYKQKKLTGWDPSKDNSKAGGTIITENAQHGNAGDLSTAAYKNMLYTANSDLVGQDLQSYYNSTFKGKSLEDYVNGYNLNAGKIRSFWNLERALNDKGATEHNKLFKDMFSNRSGNGTELWDIGYDEDIEDTVGSSTWLRRMDRYEKNFEDLSDEEKKARIHKIDLGNGNVGYVYKKANGDIGIYNPPVDPVKAATDPVTKSTDPNAPETKSSEMGGPKSSENQGVESIKTIPQMLMEGINKNPTLSYGLIRAMVLDRANRRMTDMAKESINPLLKDPFEIHRYTRSDLDAEMQGERNYADLRRLASRPLTSDGSLLTASLFLAEVQGQAARTAGKEKSNQTLRQYDELAWQQEKENAANRHETAMFNRALLWGALLDKAKLDLAYLSKRANIWDTFAQQLEYDARVKLKENKALADRFALLDISKEATYNLAKHAPELSAEAIEIWNLVVSGNTTPSELLKDPAKWQLYQQAMRALQLVEYDLLRQHYGMASSPFGRVRLATNTYTPSITEKPKDKKGGILSAKNGSQIAVAGIKAKTADAERFQRQIKECIDRNEKAIDRLSKSLYGIIKASILK